MADRLACEFFLIRYVPDVVKGEFTNIGVLLREVGAGTAVVRFTRDWSRVRCMDAGADLGLLEAMEGEIAARLAPGGADFKPVIQVLEDTLANSLQITPARACLAESISAELDQLMRMYVEPLKSVAEKLDRRRTGRTAIVGAMRTEFERAGVWALMRRRIAASEYTAAGDPMKIDCGYRAETGTKLVRMFHAVSLDGDLEAAKVLAFTAPQLRAGVERVERTSLELTAVVEAIGRDEDTEAADAYRFGVETMERQAIRVVTVDDLARMAATARVELRV